MRIYTPDGPGDEYGKDLQEQIRNIVDVNAVREFLHRPAQFEPDIVEVIIKEGGVSKPGIFKFTTVENL